MEISSKDDDDDEKYQQKNGLSTKRVYFSLLKSMINTGILYQPHSFYLGGLVYSSITCSIIGCFTLICMLWLSRAHDKYGGTYSEIAGMAIGKNGIYLLDTMIFITQFGPGAINVGFIIDLLQRALSILSIEFSEILTILILSFILIPLCLIKSLQDQFWAHLTADLIILSSIFTIGCYSLFHVSLSNITIIAPKYTIYTLGTLVYGFEGIPLLLPIKETMRSPKKFHSVVSFMIITIVLIFLCFCFVNNLAFGGKLNELVILNLPDQGWVAFVLMAYCLAVTLTMPLVLNPVFTISEKYLSIPAKWVNVSRICFICCIIVAGSCAKGYLGICVSFIGGVFSSPLAFIFPSIIHLKLIAKTNNERIQSTLGIIIGIFFGIAATISTIYFYI